MEALATEVAKLANETETEAVRKALLERKARLAGAAEKRSSRASSILRAFRETLLSGLLGKRLTREEEDEILGYGSGGV